MTFCPGHFSFTLTPHWLPCGNLFSSLIRINNKWSKQDKKLLWVEIPTGKEGFVESYSDLGEKWWESSSNRSLTNNFGADKCRLPLCLWKIMMVAAGQTKVIPTAVVKHKVLIIVMAFRKQTASTIQRRCEKPNLIKRAGWVINHLRIQSCAKLGRDF